jgi:hypothetical protein
MRRYEIRIAHRLDDTIRTVFEGLAVTPQGEVTCVVADLDQAGLHGVLERLRVIGYELVDARPLRGRKI